MLVSHEHRDTIMCPTTVTSAAKEIGRENKFSCKTSDRRRRRRLLLMHGRWMCLTIGHIIRCNWAAKLGALGAIREAGERSIKRVRTRLPTRASRRRLKRL